MKVGFFRKLFAEFCGYTESLIEKVELNCPNVKTTKLLMLHGCSLRSPNACCLKFPCFITKFIWMCKMPHLGLNSQIGRTDSLKYLLKDEDHPGNGPHLFPGFFL